MHQFLSAMLASMFVHTIIQQPVGNEQVAGHRELLGQVDICGPRVNDGKSSRVCSVLQQHILAGRSHIHPPERRGRLWQ